MLWDAVRASLLLRTTAWQMQELDVSEENEQFRP